MADYSSVLQAYEDSLSAARRAAEQAYRSTQALLNATYQSGVNTARAGYNAGAETVNNTYNTSIANRQAEGDKALSEAYTAKMMDALNLNQALSAAGKSGGAAESSLLALDNNYRTNRANIVNQTSRDTTALEQSRASELATLSQTLNETLQKLLATLNSGMGDAESRYNQSLQSALNTYNAGRAATLAKQAQDEAEAEEAARQAAQQAAAAPAAATQATAKTTQPAASGVNSSLVRTVSGLLKNGYSRAGIVNLLGSKWGSAALNRAFAALGA